MRGMSWSRTPDPSSRQRQRVFRTCEAPGRGDREGGVRECSTLPRASLQAGSVLKKYEIPAAARYFSRFLPSPLRREEGRGANHHGHSLLFPRFLSALVDGQEAILDCQRQHCHRRRIVRAIALAALPATIGLLILQQGVVHLRAEVVPVVAAELEGRLGAVVDRVEEVR